MSYSDTLLRQVLTETKTIAAVGVSTNPVRPSFYVARYLSLRNYTLFPINPAYEGEQVFDRTILGGLPALKAMGQTPDMIDVFRRSDQAGAVVDEALDLWGGDLKVIWMQIGVEDAQAAARAEAQGITVIMNRCPKIEYQRLFGELRMGGFNTGLISSKLPRA
ncbi:MAG: CoA-binding protein [Pseudomonadota bacterium]